jgi:serine/threonine protein phosphatase PrpC
MNSFVYHENPSGDESFHRIGDAWYIDEETQSFAVADSPLRYRTRTFREYPFDDFGYDAASTFCNTFVNKSREYKHLVNFNENDFKQILLKANEAIRKLNVSLGKEYNDPINYDLAETVGVGAVISGNTLFYGGVEDCYVNVLRGDNLEEISIWNYTIKKSFNYRDTLTLKGTVHDYIPASIQKQLDPADYTEYCQCAYLRNNPNVLSEKKESVGWGCFTGESEVEHFIQVYKVKLKKGDHILLFSDGMIPVLDNKDFLRWFITNQTNSYNFQLATRKKIVELLRNNEELDKEKTLIYYRF